MRILLAMVKVVSPGSGTSTNDLRPIKPPVEIPSGWAWLGWLLGLLLLAVLAYVWYRRRHRPVPLAPERVILPHEKALARLQEALELIHQPRPFTIVVADTVRWYLEERFELRAPERTTEEFLGELRQSALLAAEQQGILGEFLQRCDLVKFARYEPPLEELRDLYQVAVRLVEETKPPPLPVTAVSEATPEGSGVTS